MSEVPETVGTVLEVVPVQKKRGRPRKTVETPAKKQNHREKQATKKVETVEGHELVVHAPKKEETGFIGAWPISEGFSRMMLFKRPMDGDVSYPETFVIGDRPPVTIYRGAMVVVPNAIKNNIVDTVNEYPSCDARTDPQNPRWSKVKYTAYPHSDPVPASADEYRSFLAEQATKKRASDFIRDKK